MPPPGGLLLALLVAVLGCLPAFAEKTDVLVLVNGDSITGEIKRLERGKLTYKTDSAGTLDVEWDDVLQLISKQDFEFERSDGTMFFGSLAEPDVDGQLRIVVGAGTVDLPMVDVVVITPIKQTVWSRFDGGLGLGFNFAKASEILTFNLNGNATYRTRKYLASTWLSATVTDQAELDRNENYETGFSYKHFLAHKRFIDGTAKAERNSELDLDLRITVGGGYGWKLTQSNHSVLLVSAGLNATSELTTGAPATEENLEGRFTVDYSLFLYDSPKTDITVVYSFLPNITTSNRYRSDLNFRARREMITDFFFEITGWLKYDSKPPSETAVSSDWYLGIGLSWTF